ncbi:Adenylate cyclase; Cya3 (plasmid) [Neorhizobium galegae bv. officinalis bv. officinalis str. HAMBI 1141]|uniref:Adenylate cyclase Cya3 n=1 Tax=Neorhizobium galegae bv. officinalis bv. officinalis str. HAMBI 1141 TaxID=1028801 RepID=A0A068THV9_NEOGA|nr:winged helix-turn-helix domain-containing protein [Neorhizobium galegae]CDN57908.1 Adenylate cyclase; Cya3 [Neorhizobium galegae bv. officinalis bv. officinalis str. HAMBI 1141]
MLFLFVMATILTFGSFRLDVDAQILFCRAEPLGLGRRAVALLRVLLERAGTPVGKEALMDAAWPGLAVEDSNLTVQVAALRRALSSEAGSDWIETLQRRGYRYVGPDVKTGAAPSGKPDEPSLSSPVGSSRPSVAILRFSAPSDVNNAYFADGVAEDIAAGLSRIKWLTVIAPKSSFTYETQSLDLRRISEELDVRYILQGSVRRSGDRVRVFVEMVEARTGSLLWTERFDRPIVDIFDLQDEIALNVVGSIEPRLRRAEFERVRRKRPDSFDAYDLVLQAQPDVYCGMPTEVTTALVLLDRALLLEPDYALAHAFAAMCHHCLFLRAGLLEENRMASIRYARKALQHGSDDSLALTFAAFSIGMDEHDRDAAFAAAEAALAISPSSAITYIVGGVMFGWAGDAGRAIDWGERALRLSPFDPWAWSAFHALALGHFRLEDFGKAVMAAQKAVQLNPRHSISHMLLAASLAKLGRNLDAQSAAARVLELQPNFQYRMHFSGVDCEPALSKSLGDALHIAGLQR